MQTLGNVRTTNRSFPDAIRNLYRRLSHVAKNATPRVGTTETEIGALRVKISRLEEENRRLRRSVAIAEPPRVLGAKLDGLRTLWIGPCHMGGFSVFAERMKCTAEHMLHSSFPHERVTPFDAERFDCVIVGLTLRNLLLSATPDAALDFQHVRPDWNEDNIQRYFDNCRDEMLRQMDDIHGQCKGRPVFFVPFLTPSFKFLGNLVEEGGLLDIDTFVRRLNEGMKEGARALNQAYILDLNEMIESVGRMHLQDDIVTFYTHAVFIGDFDVSLDNQSARIVAPVSPIETYDVENRWPMLNEVVWTRLVDNMKILRQQDLVKLVIVDLDDTLWRGVAAEALPDGVDNEEHFRTIGWPMAFAEALLYFKKRGGLIAICSKNDHDATVQRFARLWGRRLTLDDFCSVRINWNRKSENIKEILGEVNVLPQAVVFVDDNPREVDEVQREFPGIRTLGFQHYDWRRIVLQAPEMQVGSVSSESRQRTELIRSKVARENSRGQVSREEWLESLALVVRFKEVASPTDSGYSRALELINKTNQFNTTGRRWTSEEMQSELSAGGYILTLSAADKHADNGVVGVAVLRGAEIVQIVLSCRVFGLGIEDAFLSRVVNQLRKSAETIVALEQATDRNLVSRDFFTRNGFVRVENGRSLLSAQMTVTSPNWIAIAAPA